MKLIPALCLLFLCLSAWAGTQSIVLRDYLSQGWTNELVSYPFSAQKGACHKDSVTLAGPNGPQAVQLSAVELYPKSPFVKSAKVSFLADLAPLGTSTYTLSFGKQAMTRARQQQPDLMVTKQQDVVSLRTTNFGLRLPLGTQTFDPAIDPAQAPAPVLVMFRGDEDFGGSRLYGASKIAAFSGTLTAAGPVYAEVALRYTYEDKSTLTITVQLAAGDSQALWATDASGDKPDDGWQLTLFKPGETVRMPWVGEFGVNKWGKLNEKVDVALEKEPAGDITRLTPWGDWWDGTTQMEWTFKTPDGRELLKASSRDAGDWVEPVAAGTLRDWSGWQKKLLPLRKLEDGSIVLTVNNAHGARKWALGAAQPGVGHRLNTVKEYVLSWPQDAGTHPHMFMTRKEMDDARLRHQPLDQAQLDYMKQYWSGGLYKSGDGYIPAYHDTFALGAYLLTGDPEIAKQAKVYERFKNDMMIQGRFDTMRYTCAVTEYYDTLIDDPITPEADRESLRALFAYLGYKLADPSTWSCERGYRSYNLNMSVANVLNLGMIAAAIPTHPKAKEWAKPAFAMLNDILTEVGPAGEFPESVTNYAGVTTSSLLAFAIAAKNAGLGDYVNDPRMKRLLLWHTKQYTPIDPRSGGDRRAGFRGLPPHGRAGAGQRESMAGVMARATKDSDPQYSKELQWAWLQEGAPTLYHDSRMGGLEYLYLDKTLPAELPKWGSEVYPLSSVMLRHGLGTPNEHQVNLICGDFSHAIFPGEGGAFAGIWSYGVPVSTSFAGGYSEREELLMSRVCIARNVGTDAERKALCGYCGFPYNLEESSTGKRVVKDKIELGGKDGIINVSAFSTLPRQDYAAVDIGMRYARGIAWEPPKGLPEWPVTAKGKAPVDWRRQTLFLKDDDPAGPTYLLLRDKVMGNQPTMWQMWTVSETVDTPENVKDVAAVLANKPGNKILPARELKGDRFTAIGQFGVDVEYFIASPTATPRHTLRWGNKYTYSPVFNFEEYHDLLLVQMPRDGAYFVAFFPRKRATAAPKFEALGDGKIIKVSGDWGTDYGFLSMQPAKATGGDAQFDGVAGSVQDRKSGLVLCLGAKGMIRYTEYGLTADGAASLRVKDAKTLVINLPAENAAHNLTITAPGAWDMDLPVKGVGFSQNTLTVAPGVTAVTLTRVK